MSRDRFIRVKLKCPKCGHVFDISKADYDAKKIECPKCKVKT